jgi:hypothetical protein
MKMSLLKPETVNDEVNRILDRVKQAKKVGCDSDSLYAELLQVLIDQGCVEVDPCTRIYNKLNGGLNNDGFKTSI